MSNDIPKPSFSSRNSSNAYQKLDQSLASSPEADKLAEDEANGTLDDHVDITDPDYNEAETKNIEYKLAAKDGITPLPEDPDLETEEVSLAIEEPNAPDPF